MGHALNNTVALLYWKVLRNGYIRITTETKQHSIYVYVVCYVWCYTGALNNTLPLVLRVLNSTLDLYVIR